MDISTPRKISPVDYVLVTPARNEADYIEKTINSVVSQTVRPKQWVIISDGSTDRTDEIVKRYSQEYDFIKLFRLDNSRQRDFASKVYAQQEGMRQINGCKYDFFGFMDGDISFDSDCFEMIFRQFQTTPELGIAGGTVYERQNGAFQSISGNRERSVGGVFQIFRKTCLDQVQLIPFRYGGEDTYIEVSAVMKGWQVRAFPEIKICHYKSPDSFRQKLKSSYIYGQRDFTCRTHPLYFLAKCVRRLAQRPFMLSSVARAAGYTAAFFRGYPREVPGDVAAYIRTEQLRRLRLPLLQNKNESKTKTKRICIMAKYRYPMYSRLQQQARALSEAGMHVDILCLQSENQPREEHLGHINVYRVCRERDRDGFLKYLWFTTSFMTASFLRLQRLLIKHPPDVLVVHTLPEYMVLTGLFHKLFGRGIVLDVVDLSLEVFESKWGRGKLAPIKPFVKLSERISCWFSNHIVTASPGFKERLIQRGTKPEKITVMMNAADTKVFTFDNDRRFEKITENAKIVYHGTVATRFGLYEAIMAIQKVREHIPGTTLHIVGRHYAEYRQKLEQLVRDLDLEGQVTLGGLQPHDRIRELIRTSDIGIVPYQSDDFMNIALSTKMFEYAASGIPIVASRLRSAESVFNDTCVSFAKPADPEDLAEKMIAICLDPELRKKKVLAAYEANEKVAGPVMAKRFCDAVENLME